MRNSIIVLISALVSVAILRIFFALANYIYRKITRMDKFNINNSKWLSIISYFLFIIIYSEVMLIDIKVLPLNAMDLYISYCVLGISSIVWCYFKWDTKKILTRPMWTDIEGLKMKKIIVFFAIFVFTLFMGYQQSLNIYTQKSIAPIFNIASTSVIAAAIALDRVMSQLYNSKLFNIIKIIEK